MMRMQEHHLRRRDELAQVDLRIVLKQWAAVLRERTVQLEPQRIPGDSEYDGDRGPHS